MILNGKEELMNKMYRCKHNPGKKIVSLHSLAMCIYLVV